MGGVTPGISVRTALTISWDPAKFNATGQEMATYLSTTKPRIALSAGGGRRGSTASENLTSISVAAFMKHRA